MLMAFLYVYGEIKVNDRLICARAGNQDMLGKKLDAMVLMLLDYDLHDVAGITTQISSTNFFLN